MVISLKILKKIMYNLIFIFLLFSYGAYASEMITVLTQPVARSTADIWRHEGLTTSLLRGLQGLGVNFNYNPASEDEIGSTVVVLTNSDALEQAIALKKEGKIKKLLVGPNFDTIFRSNYTIMLSLEIDLHLVPCAWVKTGYIEVAPALVDRIGICPQE